MPGKVEAEEEAEEEALEASVEAEAEAEGDGDGGGEEEATSLARESNTPIAELIASLCVLLPLVALGATPKFSSFECRTELP